MRTLKILFWLAMINFFPVSAWAADEFLLAANIKEKILVIYDGNRNELRRYSIAVPQNDWLPLPLRGEVKKIEVNPWWRPTKATRTAYLKKKGVELPEIVPSDDPRNGMGKVKIVIAFENFNAPIRIHGTNDPASIGKRISRGCIRMRNEDILALATIIKGLKTEVIIQ